MISDNCIKDEGVRHSRHFYVAKNIEHNRTGIFHICKECLFAVIGYNPNIEELTLDQLLHALMILNKPFFSAKWESVKKQDKERLGVYLKALHFVNGTSSKVLTFFDGEISITTNYDDDIAQREENETLSNGKFGEDVLARWGKDREIEDIQWLERYYQKMIESNNIVMPNHLQALESICSISMELKKMEINGNLNKNTKGYSDLSKTLDAKLQSSGLRPIDGKGGSEDGLNSFSQVSEKIERNGFIKPEKIEFPIDVIDEEIKILENFYMQLNNKPLLSKPIKEFEE